MSKMKELYEKVAADGVLQAKFTEIIKNAEEAGEKATNEKLTAFAKEAGYEITMEEMQAFFKGLAEAEKGALSDTELDQVAGGKTQGEVVVSLASFGIGCAVESIIAAIQKISCSDKINHDLNLKL